MILIAKEVTHKLNKEYGVSFKDGGISISGTGRKYYLCENKDNMSALKKLTDRK